MTNHLIAGQLLDHFPAAAGYRMFFTYMLAVTVIGIALTLIWLKRTKVKRRLILEQNRKGREHNE